MRRKENAALQKRHTFAVCAYRRSPYLSECLASLCAQSVRTDVIVCTSTPNEEIRALCGQYGVPLYIREGESSLAADWNFAAETAARERGAQLVTIAHQDDRYHRDYAKALLHAAALCPDMSFFCTRCRTIDAEGKEGNAAAERIKRLLRLPLRLRALSDRRLIKRLPLMFGNAIVCPSCSYNLDVTALPLFRTDERFVIDWDTLWRMAGEPGRFICIERELVDYRVHEGAETMRNIENHNREKEETEMFGRIWGPRIAAVLMHFYKRAYKAYQPAA